MSSEYAFWRYITGSKINSTILILAFLLLATNQVFETTPLTASGTIEITEGTTIPQNTSYNITTSNLPSVRSAVIFNESINDDYFRFYFPKQRMSKLIVNVSLQFLSANITSTLLVYVGQFYQSMDVTAGPIPSTYSFEPRMDEVHYSGSWWMTSCSINIGDRRLALYRVVVWAEYEVPVSPVVLNLETSDGHPLFENDYTRQMRDRYPIIEMKPENYSGFSEFRIRLQNRTLYFVPQTLTFEPGWRSVYSETTTFNVTVSENVSLTCLMHLKAVRLNLSIEPTVPFLMLSINPGYYEDTYELYLESKDIPEYLYVPPYSTVRIEIATPNLLSYDPSYYTDVFLSDSITYNATTNIQLNVTIQSLSLFGLVISPQDLIQISIGMTIFFLLIVSLLVYINDQKHRLTWKDPRLVPILILGITALIPWFSAIRDNMLYSDTQISILSFGAFPLFITSVSSDMFTLAVPSTGLYFGTMSWILFWQSLMYANYSTTPPSNINDNYRSAIALFAPALLFGIIQFWLNDQFRFAFTPSTIVQSILVLVPLVNLFAVFCLNRIGKYRHGPLKNQLALDVRLSNELHMAKKPEAIVESPTSFVNPPPTEKYELNKELNLILVITLFILSMIPTAIANVFISNGTNYVIDQTIINSPVFSIGIFLRAIFGYSGLFMSCLLAVILYYILTFGVFGEFAIESKMKLSLILFMLWVCIPVLVFLSISYTSYYSSVEWILITIPYFLCSCITVSKIGKYIKEEIDIVSLVIWLAIPILAILPGYFILNWIASIQFSEMTYSVQFWKPFPISSLFLLLLIWPLKKWFQEKLANIEVDEEMDELLFSTDIINDSG